MNRHLLAALMLLPAAAIAQRGGTPSGTADEIKRDLIQVERQIGTANLACDYRYFARVEAEEFVFIDASGGVTTRAQDLAGEKDCKPSEGTYDLDETRVLLFGGTAVVTARVTTTGKNKDGAKVTRRSRFTDVFAWRDSRWQLVAGHSSRIPSA
ncbi:MAG: nuclear transport factor 2 family protein [Gemmatimonadales bacterium]